MSDLELGHGEDRVLDVQVTDGTGVIGSVNITGSDFWFTVKADWLDPDADALMSLSTTGGDIAITDGPNGQATITIEDTDWATFANEPTQYVWGIVERDSGTTVYRLDQGTLLVTPAVLETLP